MTENWGPDRQWRWWMIITYLPLAVWSIVAGAAGWIVALFRPRQ